MESDWISALTGAVAGAAVSAFWELSVTGLREKTALSLRFVQDYLDRQDELATVDGLFKNPASARGDDDIALSNYNRITSIGNWFDVMAMCYVKNHLNRRLILDAGIRDAAHRFSEKLSTGFPELIPSDEVWVNIRDMCNMHRY